MEFFFRNETNLKVLFKLVDAVAPFAAGVVVVVAAVDIAACRQLLTLG